MTPPAFPKHLLLVEDNEHDVELARAALDESEVRCEVTVARDGQEALDLLRGGGSRQPDLVLLDLNMPRVSGHEVLRAVKGDATLRHVPVVVFTTSNEVSDRDACTAAGADDYVLKPGRFDQLVEAVDRLGRRWLTLTFSV
ncbi:response regulator containing a CheY-like receiver domain and an HTH DNA-binding domain protein [Deinococcus aerius]|uniref:Response regulator containing a CheY-like receiver domain and an HTH DNA-binding domain protein n=1 Tax=Deinococcus aerius TaxID=200253 RepID=A0A2I9DIV3_9DEIO|nr:response regulator [Deinococcus aerius]GBF06228.1 response regulator containing a CheY-like receiver domain and an HTH DNA-binding domain protein [Deinococcus aerius]